MIEIKAKVQNIYYQTDTDELGIARATSDKRITIAEAEDILIDREIFYKEVLKVKIEYIELEIPLNDLENFIQL